MTDESNRKPNTSITSSDRDAESQSLSAKRETIILRDPNTGVLGEYDVFTGELVSGGDTSNRKEDFRTIRLPDGRDALVPAGMHKDLLKPTPHIPYSPEMVGLVIDQLLNTNLGLSEICQLPGFPNLQQLHRWRRAYPNVDADIKSAFEMRAEIYGDKTVALAHELDPKTARKNEIEATKVKADIFKFRAKTDNPQRFKETVEKETIKQTNTVYIIDTGIRRKGDPGYMVDETKKLKDAEEAKFRDVTPMKNQSETKGDK